MTVILILLVLLLVIAVAVMAVALVRRQLARPAAPPSTSDPRILFPFVAQGLRRRRWMPRCGSRPQREPRSFRCSWPE